MSMDHNTVEDLVNHLVNLTFLIEFFEKHGNPTPNKWITKEFEFYNKELIEKLREAHDETRQSNKGRFGEPQARTDFESGKPRRSGSDRPSFRDEEGGDAPIRRPGL